jgi:hypothetical protein
MKSQCHRLQLAWRGYNGQWEMDVWRDITAMGGRRGSSVLGGSQVFHAVRKSHRKGKAENLRESVLGPLTILAVIQRWLRLWLCDSDPFIFTTLTISFVSFLPSQAYLTPFSQAHHSTT